MITTSTTFEQVAESTVRPIAQKTLISFTKERNESLNWFILDQSQLDGGDILATDPDDVIQAWDAYEWSDFSKDLIRVDWSRSVEFPYGVQSATCDITLNNTTQKYTYENEDSPLHGHILPKRPIRTYAGFKKSGTAEVVPAFVGLTQGMPSYSGLNNATASFTALDFLSEIGNMQISNTVMLRDVRTDEALATIFDMFGLDSSMYSLDRGSNVIPFLDLESGLNAGNVMQKLIQAENGSLWLDEKGVIRFSPRYADLGKLPVMTFNDNNIVSIAPSRTDGIVNRVKITSDIRKIQDKQPIFTASNENGYQSAPSEDTYRVKANGSVDVWISFDDPIWSATLIPLLNGSNDDSNFTAVDLSGNAISSGLTASGTLFSDAMKLTFTNTNAFAVSITYLEIWGEPAKVVDSIKFDAYDEDSVEQFGEILLDVSDNNYFGSYSNADEYATNILKTRASYSPTMNLKVKGNPALQLGDIIEVQGKFAGTYKVVGMKSAISASDGLSMEMTVERFTVLMPFILNESVLDGDRVLGG